MRYFSAIVLAGTLLAYALTAPQAAENKPAAKADAKQADAKEPLAGHSAHGEAFNEGARQKAYIMGGTGNVTFPATTSSSQAQRFINQGIGQLHGFWYFEAERSFRQAAAIDSNCAIAYWGMAFANKNNSKRGKAFIKEAVKRKANVTDREQMYIDALNGYINSKEKSRSKKSRTIANAMEKIADKYTDDIEARAFQCLFLYYSRNAKPKMKTAEVDKVMQKVLAVNPVHPVHHFRIHLWDYKDAKTALSSAALCGKAAPSIAHMWHMPGHIYSRLKRYRDAVWQQEASARTDHAHMMRDRVLPDQIHNFAHNNEWLTRNLIYVGRLHDAIDLAKNMIELPRHPKYNTLSKRGSTYYGRLRLFQVLYEYEQWDRLIALAETPYLEPSEKETEQQKRLRYLGRALYLTGNTKRGDAILAELEGELKKEEAARDAAGDAAERKARRARKPITAARPKPKAADKAKPKKRRRFRGSRRRRTNPLKSARTAATRKFATKIRNLSAAVNELKGRKAIAAGDFKTGLPLVKKSSGISRMDLARLQMQSGDTKSAESTLRTYIKSHKNEVLPLSHLVEALWKAGKKEEAKKEFTLLRKVAGEADLDAPALQRLASIAAALKWPKDWRTPQPRPKDFGQRPDLAKLGPFRWRPSKAIDWSLKDVHGKMHSLKDYRGKPVVVIFYLGYGCLHCAQQLEAFAPKTEAFRKAGYELIAISTDDQKALAKSHKNYENGKFPFPLVSDSKLDIFKKYRCYDDFEKSTLHGTFLIDAAGYVRWQDISYEPFMDPMFVLKEAKRLLEQSSVADVKAERKPTETGGSSDE